MRFTIRPNAELANGILKGLVGVFHKADPTRPVTPGALPAQRQPRL